MDIETLSIEEKNRAITHSDLMKSLKSNAGFTLVLEHLKQDAHAAMHKLKDVDPTDSKRIRELQNEIWRYDALVDKIEYIINVGEAARVEREMSKGVK